MSNVRLVYRRIIQSSCRENGVPVISLSTQKDIALEVTVTNLDKDDAYEALVIINLPNSLTYSAYRVSPDVSLFIPDTLCHL